MRAERELLERGDETPASKRVGLRIDRLTARWIRPGPTRAARRSIGDRPGHRPHQGQLPSRPDPRGAFRPAARRTSAGDRHLRRVRVMRADGPLCLALEYARWRFSAPCSATAACGRRRSPVRDRCTPQVPASPSRAAAPPRSDAQRAVCDNTCLKLRRLRHRPGQKNACITARTLNPLMAPSDIFAGRSPRQARDDVYQVGQLLGCLTGDASVRAPEVREAASTDHLKEIIYRCMASGGGRYESAGDDRRASNPAAMPRRAPCALGRPPAFTGIFEAAREANARRRGAKVQCMPSITPLCSSAANALQAAGRDAAAS